MIKKRANPLYFILSAAVTAGVFWYLFSHISPREVIGVIRGADMMAVLVFIALSFFMSFFRTWRYALLLKVLGHAPGKIALYLVVLVRNFFSDLLPARIGTLVYVYIVTSRLGVPFGAAASSFALAFLFDMLAIAPMIVLAIFWAGGGGGFSLPILLGGGLIFALLSIAVLATLPALAGLGGRILVGLPLPGKKRRLSWSNALRDTKYDLERIKQAGVYGRVFTLSLLVRTTKYASLYVLLFALLSPLGFSAQELPPAKVFLGICGAELGASLPISGLAGFGLYEGVWSLVFNLLGFPERMAKLTSISHHIFTQFYGYSLGLCALLALLLPVFQVKGRLSAIKRPLRGAFSFYNTVSLSAVIVGVLLWGIFQTGDSADPKPAVSHSLTKAQQQAIANAELPGYLIFDSNRSGTFGIYSMAHDGSEIRAVVDTSETEIYPDPSSDGDWLVFARAASPHRQAPSAIWICRPEGTEQRKLTEDGTFPTFGSRDKKVYFERGRRKVMELDIESSDVRELFPAGREDWKNYRVVKPRVSPNGQWVAFISDRGGRWNTWAASLNSTQVVHIGSGCEPAWFPDSRRLVWVRSQNVKQESGLYTYDLQSGTVSELHDDGPAWGHEYFPTLTRNGHFLLWSSCPPGQHSHIDANYQIFFMNMNDGRKVRATYDKANNRWPKLLIPHNTTAE